MNYDVFFIFFLDLASFHCGWVGVGGSAQHAGSAHHGAGPPKEIQRYALMTNAA